MQASTAWLSSIGADFSTDSGSPGCAHLRHYTVEYRIWGQGPPLVLIPGLAGGVGLVSPLARLLARDFRVISYQLRGEDDCFSLRRPCGLADLVDDLREFIDWHCLETPLVCGVSFGGLLALEFAARFPHRLGRLIVQGVGARFERGPIQQIASTVLSRFPLPTDSPFINQFFNLLFGGPQEDSPLFRFVTRQSWQTDQGVIAQRFRLAEQFAISDRVASIRVPTLILAGTRDVLVSKRTLKELNAGIDNSRVALLPGCGHLSFVSHPAFVGEHVRRFAPR